MKKHAGPRRKSPSFEYSRVAHVSLQRYPVCGKVCVVLYYVGVSVRTMSVVLGFVVESIIHAGFLCLIFCVAVLLRSTIACLLICAGFRLVYGRRRARVYSCRHQPGALRTITCITACLLIFARVCLIFARV